MPLERLPRWAGPSAHPVDIELILGRVTDTVQMLAPPLGDVGLTAAGGVLLSIEGVATFLISDGRRIVCDLEAGVAESVLEAALVGHILAILSYQRRLPPLHANLVDIDGMVVGIAGNSGAGKSTLSAALAARGHRALADDVVPIVCGATETIALPAFSPTRLWHKAATQLGVKTEDLPAAASHSRPKFFVPPASSERSGPVRLRLLIRLTRETPSARAAIVRPQAAARLQTITQSLYRPALGFLLARRGHSSLRDLSLNGVSVVDYRRKWGFDCLPESVAAIEALVREAGKC